MHKVSFGAVVHWVTLIVKQIDGSQFSSVSEQATICQVRV